jgi:replicative DNA helicase
VSVAEFRGGSGPDDSGEDYDAIFGGPPGGASPGARTPPSDHAAEQSVLGAMLLSKDAIADVVEVVRGVDFYRPAHEVVYDAIIDLYGRGEPADAVTVAAELQRRGDLDRVGGAPYLHDLVAGVPIAANAGYYAEIVREKAILRRLVDAGTKIAQLGYVGEGQVDDVVDRAQAEVYGVTERRTSEDYQPLSELMAETLDEIEAINAHDGGLAGVPTGFADLDDLTNGLHAGQMVIVAARPALGKSTLGLDMCRAASIKHGLSSVIFSLEMSRTEITMRLLSAEARIAMNHMRNGHMTDDDWSRLARKMGEVSSAPLFIDDSPNLTMMEIRAKARRLKQRQDLRLIVVDYLQLLSSGKRVESRQVEVSEFSRQMKLLAKELEVPIVAIAQLNRGAEQRTDKRPMLSDLRESGCLTAETRLLRADTGAEVSLGELLAKDMRDVPVWALDDRLKLVSRTLTHAFPSGTKEVFRVRLASGRQVEATDNHPFLTYQGWQQLSDLEVGSRVGALRHVPAPLTTTPWDDDEVVLLAHLIGDGSFVRRQPIRYASIDEANLSAVGEAASRRFGITPVRDEYAAARVTTLRLPAPYRLTHGKRNPIAAWLDEHGLFGLRSHEKFVPDGVFSLPKNQIALFLRHLWATDGSVRWDAKVGQARIYYASTSRRLIDDIALLLLRCNIFSRIKRVSKQGYRDSWHLYIYGVDNQKRFCDQVGVHGDRAERVREVLAMLEGVDANTTLDTIPKEVWTSVRETLRENQMTHRQFAAAINIQFCGSTLWKHAPSRPRLARIATVLDDANLEMLATNDIFWDQIVEIESLGERDVYDATVLGVHNFVANGIALHNSLEQDADVVILLHRDDAYDRDSTRPGEADLIVAKHRAGPTDTVVVAFQGHYSRFVDMQQA